ncbi:complement C4-A [Ictalurus punctatus]|uniref:Complement C4-A n=1 Tax=Ictalurus punctatus TaxID=7998 RepID=A0A2D0SV09_ICTPU|nr:complement C4-A [Ictalurus punctatus]
MIFLLVFGAFAHLAVEAQNPIYLITAPNIIHIGVEETVSVQLHGANKPAHVTLYFKAPFQDTKLCEPKIVTLNDDNQHQAVVTLKVDPGQFPNLQKKPQNGDQYVILVAESRDLFEKKLMLNILLSSRKGYIFIQTDKTIYNPGEHVKYRIFTLDNYLLPINERVNVQIFNSKGLLVYSHIMSSEQILQRTVTIPDVELAGHWKIAASFHNYPKSNTSVEFEVREYVLPSFEVKIEAAKHYLSLNSKHFQFSLSARYTYGKSVSGVAYVRFGLIDSKGEKTYLPGTEIQLAVEDGRADVQVLTTDLQTAAANQRLAHITDMYLYIAAAVLEKASGDLEEAESSSVKIVNSPYVIDLSRTKKYFTPGGIFSLLGTTSFPDGSRVPQLKIKADVVIDGASQTKESTGDNSGNIAITFQVPEQAKEISIKVQALGDDEDVIISDAKITSKAIQDEGGNYLSVEVQHRVLNPGQNLQVTFRDITRAASARPSHIYYLVLSKGRVLKAGRVQRTDLTSINMPFSVDMVPAFRLVAYYYSPTGKIVADSVWVDVKDVCKGKVEIVPFSELEPGQRFEVSIRTDSDSKVALSAVDSAVYILNKKGKLSPQKMFEYMNSYDLACSVGGGENSRSVLETAGLTFICNCANEVIVRDHKCYKDRQRHKRDLNLNVLVNSYKKQDRKCCEDGRKKGLMLKSCDERLKYTAHQEQSCREAFKKCCEAAAAKRKKDQLKRRITTLGRTFSSGIAEDEIDEAAVYLRSFFPQSWMWQILGADASGNIRHAQVAPDSITTWEVQAVAISPTKGFCIAEPQPLKVFQDFFISVKLPYSVKRNEQLEVKAVVFNYKQQSLQVTVKMERAAGLCSAGAGDVQQQVTVEPQSAMAVYFTVVPLTIGNIPITILAYASNKINDKIQKQLKVVGEGEVVTIEKEYNIDARTGNKLEFNISAPEDEVPGQESTTQLSFKGGVMGESVDNCLNLDGVNELIKLPTGCAEQTMVKMSPAIHAMKYLDATNQWLSLNAQRREEARTMIQAGYTRVLTYKKNDGSYGAFLKTPSSIWLTAFIAKELTRSRDIIEVQDSYIEEAISYLISKQKADGAWDDPNPLYDRGMKGGVRQSEDDVPLTAYVLISLIHAVPVYELGTDTELRVAIEKARSYLLVHLDAQQNPYAVAITAYALSLNNNQSPDAMRAHRKLMDLATCDSKRCFWDVRGKVGSLDEKADAVSLEASAYGLLQALIMQDKRKSEPIATWLTEQRRYGGGFLSTQDTVIALEALAKFSNQINDVEDLDLRVELCVNDKRRENLHLNRQTALTQRAVEVREVGKVVLNVRGQGKGTLSIVQTYRSLKKDESFCDYFSLSVKVEGELTLLSHEDEEEKLDDYYNYDDEAREEPTSRQDWFDLRTRRKRQAPEEPKKENTLVYTVCVSKKQGNSTGMVLVDVSLLTGLKPNIQDLEDNVKGTEKYIDHYDVHHDKVFLYFDKITGEETCVRFRTEQIVPVGLVQPAAAVIYDYYNPDRRCSVFYTVPKDSPMLAKLCEADVCTCAEGGCPRPKVTFSKNMDSNTRTRYACFSPIVDYVYTVKILNSSSDGVFLSYSVLITNVLQTGKDAAIQRDAVREVLQRLTCDQLELDDDADYLIMGQDDATFVGNSETRFRYIMDDKMWIEEIPPKRKCKATKSKLACEVLENFIQSHPVNKCSI